MFPMHPEYVRTPDGEAIKSPVCPWCGSLPVVILAGGRQQFCPNDECANWAWNGLLSAAQIIENGPVVWAITEDTAGFVEYQSPEYQQMNDERKKD